MAEGILPQIQYYPNTKLDRDSIRKQQTNISQEHGYKKSQQNISKLNQTMYKKE